MKKELMKMNSIWQYYYNQLEKDKQPQPFQDEQQKQQVLMIRNSHSGSSKSSQLLRFHIKMHTKNVFEIK